LPIFCYVVEHAEGIIVVDTGIPADANAPIWFPPWMRLVQRAALFRMEPEEEIGPQLQRHGLAIEDVRWVVLTHLHQDHDGGLHHFPKARIIVSRAEWNAARGLKGRLAGYLNQRWPEWLAPELVEFSSGPYGPFPGSHALTARGDVQLVPTPGHSAGHLSVLVEEEGHIVCMAGDASYSQELLLADCIDGVATDPVAQRLSHKRLLQLAGATPLVYLPAHEWDAARRLAEREPIPHECIRGNVHHKDSYKLPA
jgi:glyoxylase-like metal-dependent hydrolase (beta-lactamase superfamily II)